MITEFQKRVLLFLLGCIPIRLTIVYLASLPIYTSLLGKLAIIPAIGFLIIFFFGLRKTGVETMGKPIWWNNLRPIHAIFLLIFSYLAINKNKNAWIILLLDTIIGLIAWNIHHFLNYNSN